MIEAKIDSSPVENSMERLQIEYNKAAVKARRESS